VGVVANEAPALLGIRPGEAHDADPDAEAGWVATRALEFLAQPPAALRERVERNPTGQVAVGQAGGATHGPLGRAADPDRRSGRLRRLGRDRNARLRHTNVDEPVRPRLAKRLDDLLEATTETALLDPERLELLRAPAQTEPQDQASAGEKIDRGRVLGEPQRMMERGEHDPCGEPDAVGPRGHGRRKRQQRRHVAVVDEMVLREPAGVESQPLGLLRQFERFAVEVGVRARVAGKALTRDQSETELHERSSFQASRRRKNPRS
jgi:hypothetical protein